MVPRVMTTQARFLTNILDTPVNVTPVGHPRSLPLYLINASITVTAEQQSKLTLLRGTLAND